MVQVRKAQPEDAPQIVEVIKSAEESGFMLFNPGERQLTAEIFAKRIENMNADEKSGIFIACEEERVLGYMIVQNDTPEKIVHRGYIVIGVHSDYRGKGVGKALFSFVLDWAKTVGLHRLELTVIKNNEVAVNLYKKMGFEIEGIKKDSLYIDKVYVDEYYMAKLID